MDCDAAAAYAAKSELHALLIDRGGKRLHESYGAGYNADKPHALYSGTKSFWGPLALRAERDGALNLDETVGETFPEWRTGARKNVTLRMLLQLIAGVPFGGLGAAVPPYKKALDMQLKVVPGTTFTYGGIPLQIFGAVLAVKIAPETPHAYLERRLLRDARVGVANWRVLKDGTQPLPTGAFLTAPMWLNYGRFILDNREEFAEAFRGSRVNANYGLGWWLSDAGGRKVMYASGSGGQALYIVPDERAVVAHFGKSGRWRHETFLRRLLR
ncbi:MAG: beta-lactamase family protein [Candidatus Eremiobacteraeota bacterium]|nr:beta-lactamase family protein [Candidatus Eremiobacteraeota bacterium]